MGNIDWLISEAYMAVFILYKNNGNHSTQKEKNLGEGSEHSINVIMISDDS